MLAISSFANPLSVSIRAAAAVGPKARNPAALNSSTKPPARASSGPTTVKSIFCSVANSFNFVISVCRVSFSVHGVSTRISGKHVATFWIPGLPGATNSSVTSGLWAIFQANACSRPPFPTTNTFMSELPCFSCVIFFVSNFIHSRIPLDLVLDFANSAVL